MLSSPCSVAACGARSLTNLVVAAVRLPMLLFCDAMVWAVTFLTFPVRLLAAADRERKLERLVGAMQGQMERVVWENRDLEQRLRTALRENATMEGILDEMEEENEEAFARIDLLESQVRAEPNRSIRHLGDAEQSRARVSYTNFVLGVCSCWVGMHPAQGAQEGEHAAQGAERQVRVGQGGGHGGDRGGGWKWQRQEEGWRTEAMGRPRRRGRRRGSAEGSARRLQTRRPRRLPTVGGAGPAVAGDGAAP
ncbi:hypothetical protein ACQJBY_030271 [Aegilops geniculata]